MSATRRTLWASAIIALSALFSMSTEPTEAQQTGTLSGVVTDETTGQPVTAAEVTIPGTTFSVLTDADGRYTLRDVPAGPQQVQAATVGYTSQTQPVTITAGGTVTLDFALRVAAFRLDELVVTATGDQMRREVAQSISDIDAAERAELAPVANMNDMLVAQAPGMSVTPGNLTGAEARVRIRGTNSLSLNNDPVYYIDGIRIESSGGSNMGIGGTDISRVNDINPEEIESIEIVKGPAASALYGTDAANGVIVIKTKRGRPGTAQWQVYAEGGAIRDNNTYPTAYRGWTEGSAPDNNTQCTLTQAVANECTQDRITTFNLFEDPDASPNGTGHRQQYGAQLTGGTESISYFVSGEWEDEVGVLAMPEFAQDVIRENRFIGEVPDEQLRPNTRRRTSVRANLDVNAAPTLDLGFSTGFTTSTQRLPQTDNNTTGLLSNAFGGPGQKDNIDAATGRDLFGYRTFTPDQFFSETVTQNINRFIGSGTANWTPTSWLTGRLTGGIDYTNRVDTDLCRRGECTTFNSTIISGFKQDDRANIFSYTADANAAAAFELSESLTSRSTVGVQYAKDVFTQNSAFAENLPPGATTVTSGTIPEVEETNTSSVTLGTFIEQQFGWRDKLFLNGAVRVDDNSAFGADFSAIAYPKVGASWVVSEESFFPAVGWIDDLRLRGAWGQSGVQPGTTDALAFFSGETASVEDEDQPGIVFDAIGNSDLKPERSSEFEVGFDAGLLSGRVGLELTFYQKTTKEALLEVPIAPSVGASTDQWRNIGSVRNTGWEGSVNAQIVSTSQFGLDVIASGSYNRNTLRDLGGEPPIIGTTISQVEDHPLNSYWLQPYTFSDDDGNEIITADEIVVGDTLEFIGPNLPTTEITLSTGIELFARRLRIGAGFDYKGGGYLLNGTERIRCESRLNCDGLIDPDAPLWKQARVVALRETDARTQFGFVESTDFMRFRELSVSYRLPDHIARAIGASGATIVAAGRNLHIWTDYSGLDPETGYFGGEDIQNDFQTQPPPTYWTFRTSLTF